MKSFKIFRINNKNTNLRILKGIDVTLSNSDKNEDKVIN